MLSRPEMMPERLCMSLLLEKGLSGRELYESNLKDDGFSDESRHDNNSRKSEMLVNIGYSDVKKGYSVFRTKNASLLADIDDRIEKAIKDDVVRLQGRWVGKIGEPVRLYVTGVVSDGSFSVPEGNGGLMGAGPFGNAGNRDQNHQSNGRR